MNSYGRSKNTYSAGLVSGNISYNDTPTNAQKKLRDSQFTLSSMDNNSNLSFQAPRTSQSQSTYQRRVVLNNDSEDEEDDDSDWDLEPELEIAKVQQASLLHRRIPSLRKQPPAVVNTIVNNAPAAKINGSPYYCQEVGPQLDLGYQWPQDLQQFKRSQGFIKVSPGTNSSRQRDADRRLLTNRHKTKNRLLSMTVNLKETFNANNPKFSYDQEKIPKRILTKPSKPFRNEENDNKNFDYILKVNEILGHDPNFKYRVIDLLGQGTFGQVVKCELISTGELFSVKVIKNKSAYKTQSCMEIEILKKLNTQLDPDDKHHILRLHHIFSHKNHLCLVFELLSYNLYDLIGHNRYKGFAPEKVRAFAVQILDTLSLLKDAKIIHCDLKPENILLENEKSLTIKVIDFGSSCHEANRIYTYIQSRFYRSPEVLLGMRYTGAIDMWSFGCIVAELFLGLPLFPGSSEYNQLFRIVEMLGTPSKDMLSKGRNTNKFFSKNSIGGFDNFEYILKSREQYSHENNKNELPRKKYFPQTALKDIVLMYNNGKPQLSKEETEKRRSAGSVNYLREEEERQKEMEARLCILDFLYGVLELNPLKRWTPQQALQHPFITQKPFTGPFKPDGQIKFSTSISSSLANLDLSEKPVHSGTRKRAESMNKPVAPEQLQSIAKKIQSPIPKYPKEHASDYTKQAPSDAYRQRNTRSQGDYIGLLPPEMPVDKKKIHLEDRKVKISPQIKVRTGSHESMRVPPNDGQTVRGTLDGKSKFGNVRKSHAGEAAGGLLMMRQKDDIQVKEDNVAPNGKRTMTGAFKRRSLKQ